MPKYEVQVKASYYDELVIEADSKKEAYRIAVQEFKPTSDNLFSIDVYGLSPWEPDRDPHLVDKYQDAMRGV